VVVHVAGTISLNIVFGRNEPLKFEVRSGQNLELVLSNNSSSTVKYEVEVKSIDGSLTYTVLKLELGGKTAYIGRSTKPGHVLYQVLTPRSRAVIRASVISPRTVEDEAQITLEVKARPSPAAEAQVARAC
jgi:hypothetical protein